MKFKLYFFYFLGILYLNNIFIVKSSPDLNINSLIKSFCLKDVRSKIIKENTIYDESLGNKICDCYVKNFIDNNMQHEESINRCKEQFDKKLNSYLKE